MIRRDIVRNIFRRMTMLNYGWLLFGAFSALYFFTYIQANIVLYPFARQDDALYFGMAENIAAGNWMGAYGPLVLAKMPTFALFLALSLITGIPYLWIVSLCYIWAVSFLLRKSAYLFKNVQWLRFMLGIILLFNPYLAHALRIYRIQLPAICFLVFLASILAMFNPTSRKSHWSIKILDGFTVFVGWGMLWFSREENLFYTGCLVMAFIAFLLVKKFMSYPFRNLTLAIFGLSGVILFWLGIGSMNFRHYGRFIVCEKTSAPYTDMAKTFHSIADPDLPEHFSGSTASRQKIMTIAEVVPMFAPMAHQLILSASTWKGTYFDTDVMDFVRKPDDALTISHFEWAWIDAANKSGYYKDALTVARFYINLDRGIKNALREGKLSKKANVLAHVGPYTLSTKSIVTIIRLLPKRYFEVLLKPSTIAGHRNLLVQVSPNIKGTEAARKIWKERLKIQYILEGEDMALYQEELDSFSNIVWNTATTVFGYTAAPLMHLATPLAVIAFLLCLIRKRWVFSALIVVVSSTYLVHYLMLVTLEIVSGYKGATVGYFLPSYDPLVFTAFLSISMILQSYLPIFRQDKRFERHRDDFLLGANSENSRNGIK